MTTPANRAPKFAFADNRASLCGSYPTEADAREAAARYEKQWPSAAPVTIHHLGPALPAKVAVKSMGQIVYGMTFSRGAHWDTIGSLAQSVYESAASAVIAAHEAGRETERVVRYALRGPDGKWWSHVKSEYVADRTQRRLWEDRYEAEKWFEEGDTIVKVTITTRRRRVVKS